MIHVVTHAQRRIYAQQLTAMHRMRREVFVGTRGWKLQTREERRRRSLGGDDELMARARALSAAHLDGLAEPASVRWVDNQQRRWGSCTPADRSIRLSSRLRSMPAKRSTQPHFCRQRNLTQTAQKCCSLRKLLIALPSVALLTASKQSGQTHHLWERV